MDDSDNKPDYSKCLWPAHGDCQEPVVAVVGLPGPNALPVCSAGFDAYRKHKEMTRDAS